MQNVARSNENAPHWENDIVLMEVIKRNEQYPIKLSEPALVKGWTGCPSEYLLASSLDNMLQIRLTCFCNSSRGNNMRTSRL